MTQEKALKNLKPDTVIEYRMTKEEMKRIGGISGNIDGFIGPDGVNVNGNLKADYNGFHLTSMLDSGFLGDTEGRKDWKKLFSENHAYLDIGGTPFSLASELCLATDPELNRERAGIKVRLLENAGATISADFYPISSKEEMELWVRGVVNLGKGTALYGMFKNFFKKGKDGNLGKMGVSHKKRQKQKMVFESRIRNFPIKSPHGLIKDHSRYVGVGHGGTFKELYK